MIWIAVAASAPSKAQTVPCGFPACDKSYEISPAIGGAKIAKFLVCYNNALNTWDTGKAVAWNTFVQDQRVVIAAVVGTEVGCRFGIKSQTLIGLLKKISQKLVPYYCEIKAVAAGVTAEALALHEYWITMDNLCLIVDITVRNCAKAVDPNFKECNL